MVALVVVRNEQVEHRLVVLDEVVGMVLVVEGVVALVFVAQVVAQKLDTTLVVVAVGSIVEVQLVVAQLQLQMDSKLVVEERRPELLEEGCSYFFEKRKKTVCVLFLFRNLKLDKSNSEFLWLFYNAELK